MPLGDWANAHTSISRITYDTTYPTSHVRSYHYQYLNYFSVFALTRVCIHLLVSLFIRTTKSWSRASLPSELRLSRTMSISRHAGTRQSRRSKRTDTSNRLHETGQGNCIFLPRPCGLTLSGSISHLCPSICYRYLYLEYITHWQTADLFIGLFYLARQGIRDYPAAEVVTNGKRVHPKGLERPAAIELKV